MQEYNQDLVLVQGTEVVYWKLLQVNTYYLIFMKLQNSKHCSNIFLYISNCMIIEPWYAGFSRNYFRVHLKSIYGALVGTRGHGRR